MTAGPPYRDIVDWLDRRKSFELLDALGRTLDFDELFEIGEALAELDDPRLVEPLRTIVHDPAQPSRRRHTAADVLRAMDNVPPRTDAELRQAWGAGDVILRSDAIAEMGDAQRDIIESVLDDRDHPRHADAVDTLGFGCSESWAIDRLVAALSHPSADVRAGACETLVWSEPLRAHDRLIERLMTPTLTSQSPRWKHCSTTGRG